MTVRLEPLNQNTALVHVSGRLDHNQTPELEAQLDELLQSGRIRLIVDLSEVTYVNSGGLRCLVTAWRQARRQGGNVLLSGLRKRVHEVFVMVGFDKVFQVYPTRREALRVWQEQG